MYPLRSTVFSLLAQILPRVISPQQWLTAGTLPHAASPFSADNSQFSEQDQNSCGMNRYQVVRGTKQTLTLHRSASQGIKRTAGFRWICWSSVLPNVFLAVRLEMNIHPVCSWLQEVAAVSDNTFCLFKRAFIPSQ